MRRLSLALTVCVVTLLSGCDSGLDPTPGPGTPPPSTSPLVGTFSLTGSVLEHYATSTTAQDWIALDEPPAGQIALTGAESGQLRYGAVDYNSSDLRANFASEPVGFPPQTYPHYYLSARQPATFNQSEYVLTVRRSASQSISYTGQLIGPPFTRDGAQLSVPTVTLTGPAGQTVRVEGSTLVFPRIALPVGIRTRVHRQERPLTTEYAVQYTLQSNYALLVTETVPPSAPRAYVGTWTATPDSVSLSYGPYVNNPLRHRFEVTGDQVTLWNRDAATSCDTVEECGIRAFRHGLQSGTLSRFEVEVGGRYLRGGN